MFCISTAAHHLHSHTYKHADVHILPSFSLQAALEKNDTIAQSISHMASRTVPTLKAVLGCLTFAKCTVPHPLRTPLLSSPSQGPPVWTAAAKLAALLVENIRHTWRASVVASLPERERRKERENERRVERYRECVFVCVWVALFPALWTCLPASPVTLSLRTHPRVHRPNPLQHGSNLRPPHRQNVEHKQDWGYMLQPCLSLRLCLGLGPQPALTIRHLFTFEAGSTPLCFVFFPS